jgi:hypothetical protein
VEDKTGTVPVPDPTKLTTDAVDRMAEQLRRESDMSNALLKLQLTNLQNESVQQLTALREFVLSNIEIVRDVSLEKFSAIDGTFQSNALALTAALAAQKEAAAEQNKSNTLAITKSEVSTKETIASNAAQNATSLKAAEDKIADLKSRLDKGEGSDKGQTDARTEIRTETGNKYLLYNVLIGAVAILASVLIAILLKG